MPQRVLVRILPETKIATPFRLFCSGSSESGKTYFAEQLLKRPDLFQEKIEYVKYYYPCYLNTAPVEWHKSLDIPVSYKVGLPSKEELVDLPQNTCVVIDDLYDKAVASEAIDHLFRVISGKKKISVIIITQDYYIQGRKGRSIRNSSNYTALFRNCADISINRTVCRQMGITAAYNAAEKDSKGLVYPYYFIDQSQRGQVTAYQLYTDIFSGYPVVYSNDGMKGYVINPQDFKAFFELLNDKEAILKNGKHKSIGQDESVKATETITKSEPITKHEKESTSASEIEPERETQNNGPSENQKQVNSKQNYKEISTNNPIGPRDPRFKSITKRRPRQRYRKSIYKH